MTSWVRKTPGPGTRPISPHPPPATINDVPTARATQILTPGHVALQGAQANSVSGTNSRIALFAGLVSSTRIALALVGQMSISGLALQVVPLILLPPVLAELSVR